MKIFGWSADSSGCGWYRMRMPLDELARRSHDTLVSMELPNEWLDTCDVLIGQRVCMPNATIAWQRIARHRKRPMMVFELDDDLWHVDPSSAESYAFFSRPETQEHLRRNIAVADLVTVSTEPLADVVRAINPTVVVVPNFVPQAMLDLPMNDRIDSRVVIGWAGSSTHVMDFADVGPQLARFLDRNSAAALCTIGGDRHGFQRRFPWSRRIDRGQWHVLPWQKDIWAYYRALGAFDVATAPLAAHTFNVSKSAVKALEAAARGIPIVASTVGPYPRFVRHGETGLLLRHAHEWPGALRDLVLDPQMRAEMGAHAKHLAAGHTIEANGHLWEDALLAQLATTTSRKEAS